MSSSSGDGERASGSKRFFEVNGIQVESKILEESFICNPTRFQCSSCCCARGCLMLPHEIENVKKHWDTVKTYLEPEKQDLIEGRGEKTFYQQCQPNCPCGYELGEEEQKYMLAQMARGAKVEFYCSRNVGTMCVFAYKKKGEFLCALHSTAMELEIPLKEIKPMDCIQFPLAVVKQEDKTYLIYQEVPELDHLPCHNQKSERLMYEDLKTSIVALLGQEFYTELVIFAKDREKDAVLQQ